KLKLHDIWLLRCTSSGAFTKGTRNLERKLHGESNKRNPKSSALNHWLQQQHWSGQVKNVRATTCGDRSRRRFRRISRRQSAQQDAGKSNLDRPYESPPVSAVALPGGNL